jgi:hypothetical protein
MYIFPILVHCIKKKLATLSLAESGRLASYEQKEFSIKSDHLNNYLVAHSGPAVSKPSSLISINVARFFLVQYTPKQGKYISNCHKLYQMGTKYTQWP